MILDPTSVHTRGAGCGRITHVFGNASMNSDLFCMFLISVSYEVLSVLLPHSCYLLCMVTSKFANCSSRTKLTQMRRTSSRTPASHAHLKTNAAFWFDRCNPLLLSSQWTPLHESSYHGHAEICKLLMECKADVNARTRCQKPRLVSSPSPSPSAMQQQQNCTRIRNRRKQGRRHRSFAQQRGAAVSAAEQSPPPHNDELSNKFIPSLRHANGLPKADGRATESCYPDPGELFLQLRALFQALAPVLHTPPRGEGARARGGQAARAWSAINATHTALEGAHCFIADGEKKGPVSEAKTERGREEEGKHMGWQGGAAAHWRTCTRWLLESATTMRPSLSMAMPPRGWLNCPYPEPSLPMVRT